MLFRGFRFMAPIVAALLLLAFSAYAYDNQERYTNNTGEVAYDLTKILMGDVNVTNAIKDKFKRWNATHPQGTHTVIHWDSGSVNPGQSTWACFSTHPHAKQKVICALWTDAYGQFIGVAGPTVSNNVTFGRIGDAIAVSLHHDWVEWTGTSYPITTIETGAPHGSITISNVYYALTNRTWPLDSLNESLYSGAGLNWQPLNSDVLSYGDSTVYEVPNPTNLSVVLLRFTADGDGYQADEIIQAPTRPVPSLTNYGLILLILLLAVAAFFALRERRRRTLIC